MASNEVAALIVPPGKIVDFIDGKFRKDTPEEYVRQEIEKSLVREYEYPRHDVEVEFSIKIGRSRKRVDLAPFPEATPHKQETMWAAIECKASDTSANDKKEGVEQLKSYMAACVNCEFGLWTNGHERYCFRKVITTKGVEFSDINDIPVKGQSLEDAERPTITTLKAATSDALLFTFRRCHNYIAGNQGLQKPEAFWELLKLIFCKITDERSDKLHFYATTKERHSRNGQLKVRARLDALFQEVRAKYTSIFNPNDVIELEPRVLAYLVSQLQAYSLLDSEVDVKGKAYEEIVGSNLRGDRGEFFTPRNICKLAVSMLDPHPKLVVLDPACGTGGFLITAMNHVIAKIRASEKGKRRKKDAPSEREQMELFRRVQDYAQTRLFGLDLNPNLVKAAKMNMVLNNDGSGGLFQANSLDRPIAWSSEVRNLDLIGRVDLLFTNPPFGSKIPVDDPVIVEQYDLAHTWEYDALRDVYSMVPGSLVKSQPPEILFIERCVQFLKPGRGVMAIVLPDAILGAPGLGYVREWILRNTQILASIDLHPDTFQPKNSTQTSLVLLKRKSARQIDLEKVAKEKHDYGVFVALANHIGHDKRGNTTYVRDAEGNDVTETRVETMKEVRDGVPVYRNVETTYKVIDDNTPVIAEKFRNWWAQQ